MSQGFDYFKEPTNWYDIAADTTIIIYCFSKFTSPYPWGKEEEEELQRFLAFGAFFMNVRLLFHFCVISEKLRQIMTVI